MSKIVETGSTYRTEDYTVFTRLEGNRQVLAARAHKIKNSIQKNGLIFNPIVVNEKYQVIDGQGRLEALKLLGLPVDFVIAEGAGLEQCIALNASGTIWTMQDYIDSYCEMGNENYIRIRTVMKEFPDIGTQAKLSIISGYASVPTESIKKGTAKCTEAMVAIAREDLRFAERFAETLKRVKGSTNQYIYALVFARKSGANQTRLLETMEKADLPPAPRLRNALDIISDIYNKRLQTGRIYLFKDYEESMSDKYGWYGAKWGSKEKSSDD